MSMAMAMHLKQLPMGWNYLFFSCVSFSANYADRFE
jgi:hypothetical protein